MDARRARLRKSERPPWDVPLMTRAVLVRRELHPRRRRWVLNPAAADRKFSQSTSPGIEITPVKAKCFAVTRSRARSTESLSGLKGH